MKKLISKIMIVGLLTGTGAYGTLGYAAYQQMPKTISEHKYVRCAAFLHRIAEKPQSTLNAKTRARQRRCGRMARRFSARHADRAQTLKRDLPDLPLID